MAAKNKHLAEGNKTVGSDETTNKQEETKPTGC
jgi:hypothetical protein